MQGRSQRTTLPASGSAASVPGQAVPPRVATSQALPPRVAPPQALPPRVAPPQALPPHVAPPQALSLAAPAQGAALVAAPQAQQLPFLAGTCSNGAGLQERADVLCAEVGNLTQIFQTTLSKLSIAATSLCEEIQYANYLRSAALRGNQETLLARQYSVLVERHQALLEEYHRLRYAQAADGTFEQLEMAPEQLATASQLQQQSPADYQQPQVGYQQWPASNREPQATYLQWPAGHRQTPASYQQPSASHQQRLAGYQHPIAGHEQVQSALQHPQPQQAVPVAVQHADRVMYQPRAELQRQVQGPREGHNVSPEANSTPHSATVASSENEGAEAVDKFKAKKAQYAGPEPVRLPPLAQFLDWPLAEKVEARSYDDYENEDAASNLLPSIEKPGSTAGSGNEERWEGADEWDEAPNRKRKFIQQK